MPHQRANTRCQVTSGLRSRRFHPQRGACGSWRTGRFLKPAGLQLLAAHGNVYVLASTGTFALRGKDGQLVWQAPGGNSIGRAVLSVGA